MYSAETIQQLTAKFSDAQAIPVPEKFIRDPEPAVRVPAAKLLEVSKFLKSSMAFDVPVQMTAVDYIKEGNFELVYYVYSSTKKQGLVFKVTIPRSAPEVDSVTPVWSGMDWQEREVFDLMGITFKGHPNLKRIMMWDGFPGFPLRKDYVHITDKYDSGLEIGTPGLNEKGVPVVTPS